MRVLIGADLLPALIALSGCAGSPGNPSFDLTPSQAGEAIDQMRAQPKSLTRPLVVVGGFLNPGFITAWRAGAFRDISRDSTVIPVNIGFCNSFEDCRARIIEAIERACPSDDSNFTVEVDVIGLSLGGLAARYAAMEVSRDGKPTRRLKIARLFTISSPHTGANLAGQISLTQFHRDMRPGSVFLRDLAAARRDYELHPYVLLRDGIVGAQNAAPFGTNPWWLPTSPLAPAHWAAMLDDRIFADIARRLRGEQPFTHSPPAPLPD